MIKMRMRMGQQGINHQPGLSVQEAHEAELTGLYGDTIGGQPLMQALGFESEAAFMEAWQKQELPVPVFTVVGEAGKYAKSKDIARWMAALYESAMREMDAE